jgi:hypothetical protein
MSFVQRRRFLWILFLAGLALLAIAANATTLSRLRFEDLVKQATAVARLRCLGAESRWQDGEIVVAVDAASGAAAGAAISGWSCAAPGPAQFDGAYQIDGLAVGHSYTVYAEALNGAVDPSQFDNAIASLCRNVVTDAGWPPLLGCVVPAVDASFTARTRPGP